MAKIFTIKDKRKKTNKEIAKKELPIILDAIETAKRALKALYDKKKLYERILKEE